MTKEKKQKQKKQKNVGSESRTTKNVESESESSTRKTKETTQETQKRKNVESESESTPKVTTQKASKKQKTLENVSSVAPTRLSERISGISRQDSDLSGVKNLRISSGSSSSSRSSFGLKDLSDSASQFVVEDMEALNATFVPASNESEVIPAVEVTDFPSKYIVSDINRSILEKGDFDVDNINSNDGYVQTFFQKLHEIIINQGLDIGRKESKTDSLVTHLLYTAFAFDKWPLLIKTKEKYELFVSDKKVSAIAEFVITKRGLAMTIVEDKHLKNIKAKSDFGEAQLLAEMLAVADENTTEELTDQNIFAIRVISTYVTFYKAMISKEYLKEIGKGLPRKHSIQVQRWPSQNGLKTGFDLAEANGRQSVFMALARIYRFLLQPTSSFSRKERKESKESIKEGKKPQK